MYQLTKFVLCQESALFPPIIPQGSSFQAFGRGRSIAMAGLSRDGMMMIQGAGPKTAEPVPTSISQSKMKKRGKVKNWSRKQLLMRQKAVLDKVLHVDARIEDLRNIFSQADETQTYVNPMGDSHVKRTRVLVVPSWILSRKKKNSVSCCCFRIGNLKVRKNSRHAHSTLSFLVPLRSSFRAPWSFLYGSSYTPGV